MSTQAEKHYYVYMMANDRNGVIYTGVANDLIRRVNQHKTDCFEGFTKRYQAHNLVYFEETGDLDSALNHEKRIKTWPRKRKIDLIETRNHEWKDLWPEIIEG